MTFYNEDGNLVIAPDDFLLIRRSLVERIWFYYKDGIPYAPDEITEGHKTLHFYWPADLSSPYLQKNNQRRYTIVIGDRDSYPAHDKRIGCIPRQD